jgi:hypothetical protein
MRVFLPEKADCLSSGLVCLWSMGENEIAAMNIRFRTQVAARGQGEAIC